MSDIPEIPNVQSPKEIVDAAIKVGLHERLQELYAIKDIAAFVNMLTENYQGARPALFSAIVETAGLVEPEDRSVGRDPELPAAHAFSWGEVLGVHVAERLMGQDVSRLKHNLAGMIVGVTKGRTITEGAGETFMDFGGQGMERAQAAEDLVEKAADAVCPQITQQIYFKRGFGYVIFVATETMRLLEEERQQAKIDEAMQTVEGFDWDEAFKAM